MSKGKRAEVACPHCGQAIPFSIFGKAAGKRSGAKRKGKGEFMRALARQRWAKKKDDP